MADFTQYLSEIQAAVNDTPHGCTARARVFLWGTDDRSSVLENLTVIGFEFAEQKAVLQMGNPLPEALATALHRAPVDVRLDVRLPHSTALPSPRLVLEGTFEMRDKSAWFIPSKGHFFFQRPGRIVPPVDCKIHLAVFDHAREMPVTCAVLVSDISENGIAFLVRRDEPAVQWLDQGSQWEIRLYVVCAGLMIFPEGRMVRVEPVRAEFLAPSRLALITGMGCTADELAKVAVAVGDSHYPHAVRPILEMWLERDPTLFLGTREPLEVRASK